jgi:uncharacterized protein (TIGR00730 family)
VETNALTVFCGSSPGADPAHMASAEALGAGLAARGVTLVYGGGQVGLMGAVADGALAAGGTVVGVMTRPLVEREIAHLGLSTLEVVETMHERKARMADLADGFVMLPGGYGTLDEFCEVLTWTQLGIHRKPCAVLDATGYFGPLLAQFDRSVEQRFVKPEHRDLVLAATTVDELFDRLAGWEPTYADKWLDRTDR